MAPYRFYFIGTQLLFLSQITSSFILLTANMDDVKRIAQKFVSESLAEKIAEFVAKATHQMVANVSHENEQNADEPYLSEEHNNLQHIVRQREETTTKKALETSKHVEYEEDTTTNKYKGQDIDWKKEINELFNVSENNDVYSKEEIPKDNNEQKKEIKDYNQEEDYDKNDDQNADYDQQRADYEQSKIDEKKKIKEQREQDYEEQKLIYKQQKMKHQLNAKTDHDPKRKPTNQQDKTQSKKRIYSKIRKPHSNQTTKDRRTTRKTISSTFLYQHNILRKGVDTFSDENTKTTLRGFNIQRALTTEKARNEFDQYDNPNYAKAEFIATSGPVVLPKVAMAKPWWEKEMAV